MSTSRSAGGDEGFGLAKPATRSLVQQIRKYIDNDHGETPDRPFILYGRSAQATIGVYVGQGLLNRGISDSALQTFQENSDIVDVTTPSLAMQLCGPAYNSTQTFGVMVTSNSTFAPIQKAMQSWLNATCLTFAGSQDFPGKVAFGLPLINVTLLPLANGTLPGSTRANSTLRARASPHQCRSNPLLEVGISLMGVSPAGFGHVLEKRAECKTIQVNEGNGCAELAVRCGIWGAQFTDCGPQKPDTKPPTDGSKIADLNPCPLNACCNIWGQCGVTRDFCIDTNTGPPGTAKRGTYGCISNCGVDVVKGTGNGAIKLAYFQGYGLGRKCLYQDALQIDPSYTHVHFGFGTLTPSFEVQVGDMLSSYQFGEFKRINSAKRILSFGGWAFSNNLDTYMIFRNMVQPANRLTAARNIASFIIEHGLDGVDIDWEYPGAPDLPPGINDPGLKSEGADYLVFLAMLKTLLAGRTVAIAAPASYWYLKQFPIKNISRVVDYIVYMTYDLHGQWDAKNKYSQEDCDTGNCLRSQVNLTETRQALAMITKAGVPGNKIVAGVTSYGQSFNMAEPGSGVHRDAEINEIINGDGGSGLLKRADGRVVTHFLDPGSNSDILVYDNNRWIGYMSEKIKAVRSRLYASLGMAGTTDWASDLKKFNPAPPPPLKSWPSFISLAAAGKDPKASNLNLGSWRIPKCTAPEVKKLYDYTPSERWKALGAADAWAEAAKHFNENDKARKLHFLKSFEMTLQSGQSMSCDMIDGADKCDGIFECPAGADGDESGPAAMLIWQSLIQVHKLHHDYYKALGGMQVEVQTGIRRMEGIFSSVPEPKTNQFLNVLIDIITIGALGSAAPFFNSFLKTLPGFATRDAAFDNTKYTVLMLIGQGTTLAKDLLQTPEMSDWDEKNQKSFSDILSNVIVAWKNSTAHAVGKLFKGDGSSLDLLTNIISDGKMIDGNVTEDAIKFSTPSAPEITAMATKPFFGFAIPALWRRSSTYAFILDSGQSCGGNPLSKYDSDVTASTTSVCHDNRLYYLVHPDGDAVSCKCERDSDMGPCQRQCRNNKFSAPVGLDSLNGGSFGRVTKEDIVIGSLATWLHNGRVNKKVSITDLVQKQDIRESMVGLRVNTPGIVQPPVCSPDRAFQSWNTGGKGSSPYYPCDIPPGVDHCGDSTFENRGSDVSPRVEDCLQIIKNFEGDAKTDWTHSITGHRTIVEFGTCHLGIERTGGTGGAVQFRVGGQDVIDIINDAVRQFGGGGRLGGRGVMSCAGTTVNTRVDVLWGIY
ncbi:hypothetical protein RB595_010461 [Gaeumannomyces hyphopodioides]